MPSPIVFIWLLLFTFPTLGIETLSSAKVAVANWDASPYRDVELELNIFVYSYFSMASLFYVSRSYFSKIACCAYLCWPNLVLSSYRWASLSLMIFFADSIYLTGLEFRSYYVVIRNFDLLCNFFADFWCICLLGWDPSWASESYETSVFKTSESILLFWESSPFKLPYDMVYCKLSSVVNFIVGDGKCIKS